MIGATSADLGGKTGFMLRGARHLAGVIADRGVPTYYYRFSYIAESARKSATEGVTHAGDLPYWFDTVSVKYGEATTARDAAVGAIVSGYLVNFVKTGDPNGPGLPRWQPYIRASDAMLNFAVDGGAVPGKDPWAADLDTVQDVPAATAAK
jgi:para-nitrobenzyl esterase